MNINQKEKSFQSTQASRHNYENRTKWMGLWRPLLTLVASYLFEYADQAAQHTMDTHRFQAQHHKRQQTEDLTLGEKV